MKVNGGKKQRRVWLWTTVGLVGLLAVILAIFLSAVPLSSDTLRRRIVASLSAQLESDVQLADLQLRVFPRLHAAGSGLVIRRRGLHDLPPLISITRFSVDANLIGLVRKHVAHVDLEGLEIGIPPGEDDNGKPHDDHSLKNGVVVDTLDANNARLVFIPRKKDKAPKVWAIHTLRMHNVGIEQAMPFDATLTNAVPPGEIVTSGSFGPWQRNEPGDTPLQGTFTFDRADLGVFKGIAGTLSSQGSFGGSLGRIDINGETDTPNFTINVSGHPFPLHTKYHSVVDGTNGDTRLERIDARFLESSLVAKGAVLDAPPGTKGRIVSLDIQMDDAHLEDVMVMAVKTPKPPMTGGLKLTTKFLLPPGETDVSQRLQLDGRFTIADARFSDYDVQGKINELSRRGRGRTPEEPKDGVVSDFHGQFTLGAGTLVLPEVGFHVPGARVELTGQYALTAETLDFRGTLFMDAKISETTTGVKSLLLKAADPLFNTDGGGSAIPIKIAGQRDDPAFGLDARRVFRRGDTP